MLLGLFIWLAVASSDDPLSAVRPPSLTNENVSPSRAVGRDDENDDVVDVNVDVDSEVVCIGR